MRALKPNTELVRARWLLAGIDAMGRPELLEDGAVAHADGRILAVGTHAELVAAHPQARVRHFSHHVLMPGLVNAHHHLGLTPLQMGSPDLPLELWFASRLAGRDLDLELDTLYSAFELIASGVTCVQHLQPRIAGDTAQMFAGASAVLSAYQRVGLRVSYSLGVREQNRLVYEDDAAFCARLPAALGEPLRALLARHTQSLEDQLEVYTRLREAHADSPLVRLQLAPANLHWTTDDGLRQLAERSRTDDVPLHMHLLETPYQREYARRRTGTTAVRHLERLGLLGPLMTLGHAVWLDEEEMDILSHTGTCVCHNCSSNLRIRSGLTPVAALRQRGVPIALGIDEAGMDDDRNMFLEMRLALRLHGSPGIEGDPGPGCSDIFRMATEHGAATTAWRGEIGRLATGLQFDAVAIDWRAATYPYQDHGVPILDALLQRAQPRHVDTVFIGGEEVYAKGHFLNVDRDAVLAEIASRLAQPLNAAETARRELAHAVMPHVRAFYDGYLP